MIDSIKKYWKTLPLMLFIGILLGYYCAEWQHAANMRYKLQFTKDSLQVEIMKRDLRHE